MKGAFSGGPFAEIARRNMEMFEAATNAFTPKSKPNAESKDDEIAALKAQLAELQSKIEKLG
jgi:polyhydroxyalkanoate synthesis regulator protein